MHWNSKKILNILIIGIVILSLGKFLNSSFQTGNFNTNNSTRSKIKGDIPFTSSFNVTEPFLFNNDSQLSEIALNNLWNGDGSYDNPYIIEGYEIISNDENTSNIIFNQTNSFVEIKNCSIKGGWAGIEIISSDNIKIYNNTFTNLSYAIYSDSNHKNLNISISYNIIYNNIMDGIHLKNVQASILCNEIYNNSISGAFLNNIYDLRFNYNKIYNNSFYGVDIGYIDDNNTIILSNFIHDNQLAGVKVQFCDYLNFFYNEFINNKQEGIHFFGRYSTLSNNTFFGNIEGGFISYEGTHNTLTFNNFAQNVFNNSLRESEASAPPDTNTFDSNFWYSWTYPDTNKDGIVDQPYYQGPDGLYLKDFHPLTNMVPTNYSHILTRPTFSNPTTYGHFNPDNQFVWQPSRDSEGYNISYSMFYKFKPENSSTWSDWELQIENLTENYYNFDFRENLGNGTLILKIVSENILGVKRETISKELNITKQPDTTDNNVNQENPYRGDKSANIILIFIIISSLSIFHPVYNRRKLDKDLDTLRIQEEDPFMFKPELNTFEKIKKFFVELGLTEEGIRNYKKLVILLVLLVVILTLIDLFITIRIFTNIMVFIIISLFLIQIYVYLKPTNFLISKNRDPNVELEEQGKMETNKTYKQKIKKNFNYYRMLLIGLVIFFILYIIENIIYDWGFKSKRLDTFSLVIGIFIISLIIFIITKAKRYIFFNKRIELIKKQI